MTGLDRGAFTLSLDFELIWGTLDLFGPERFAEACTRERTVVVPRLLDLLADFGVAATWCVLGHLFLDRCAPVEGVVHADVVRPTHAWCRRDWFAHDPGSSEPVQPLYYARSLVDAIRACRVPQEIGCHSFSHVIFGDPGCSPATAESEVAAAVRAAQRMGLTLRSFAFPRNSVGHLDVLRRHGFTCYRGPGPRWYEGDDAPGALRRLAHLVDVATAAEPPTVLPDTTPSGLVNLPGSMIYFPRHGVRRYVPMARRVARAVKGLEAAARSRRVFHLWFHPTNLADGTDEMFAGLRAILERVQALREAGDLEVRPMGSFAPRDARPAAELPSS